MQVRLDVDTLLDVKEVAQAVHRSTDTILVAIKSGMLPAHRMGERKWMLLRADVEQWIENGMHTYPPKEPGR